MSEFPLHWAHPERLPWLGAWLVVVVLLFWLERRGGGALDRLVGAGLVERLVERPAAWRRTAIFAPAANGNPSAVAFS